jgi:hypothetical protein
MNSVKVTVAITAIIEFFCQMNEFQYLTHSYLRLPMQVSHKMLPDQHSLSDVVQKKFEKNYTFCNLRPPKGDFAIPASTFRPHLSDDAVP